MVLHVALVTDNNIGVEGAKALGPHLAKLVNINALDLSGRKRTWDVCERCGCVIVLLWLSKSTCACVVWGVGSREQHWRGRRKGAGSTPGQACEH